MKWTPCLVAMGLGIAPSLSDETKPIPLGPLSPLAELDAGKGTNFVARNHRMKRLIDECMEISKRRKAQPPGTTEDRARLVKLHAELDRLDDEQKEDLRLAGLLEDENEQAPSDAYFKGWELSREAAKLRDEGDIAGSREKLESALRRFERISKEHPSWKPEMVKSRITKTKEELSALPATEE